MEQLHEETISKTFLSMRDALNYVQFIATDRVLIETIPDGWKVSYMATRCTVTSPNEGTTEVDVTS
jgi:hypothetical protein|nr:MAG TPA: hypothetical protein [Caudoviricetes sp.]